MNLKSIFLSLAASGLLFTAFSCGGGSNTAIKNDKLHPFLLSGTYTLQGYGGGASYYPYIKQYVTADPGSKKFASQLNEAYEQTFIFPYGTNDQSDYQQALADWWGIENKADFLETQEWLLTNGHQTPYEKTRKALEENQGANADIAAIDLNMYGLDEDDALKNLRFVKDNYDKFSNAGIKAWDIVRYVNNVNMGHAAGYISDSEGTEMAKKALVEAQKYYDSWADYFNDFNLGRGFWSGDNDTSFKQTTAELLDNENAYNIYSYIGIK